MSLDPMITFRNLKKRYKLKGGVRKIITKDFSGVFPKANIGILGENGAGKSTLMKMIAGVERPESGQITRHVLTSWPLGFAGSFNSSLSGAENVRFVARIYGQDTERLEQFTLEFSELGDFFHMPVQSYSSGMKARLAFGVSMGIRFECYLVDEITAVGDAKFKARCQEVFQERLQDSNIIMISHSPGTIRQYCDMAIVLRGGEVTFYDDLEKGLWDHQKYMEA